MDRTLLNRLSTLFSLAVMMVLLALLTTAASAANEESAPADTITSADSVKFSQKLDIQLRYDNRSNRPSREQYRFRYYPSVSLSKAWSLHSFVVTGDGFSSSHNTIGSSNTDHLYARRLYARHESEYGKTEFGIIPTYKGRVSSTGLSKDGWITGFRHVRSLRNNSAIEVVVGQLANEQANHALDIGKGNSDDNYFEVEYSARMGQRHSYEASIERMLRGDFLRAEYRFNYSSDNTLFFENVQRIDASANKFVAGMSGEFSGERVALPYPIEYFAYYSYVDDGFGDRVELTEDFLGTGHGGSVEFSSVLSRQHDTDWFVRVDTVGGVTRLLAGVKLSLNR
ncbi:MULTISPECIES: hypothetical protein [unclassified Alteromonas]|uniref:hypothetical protein n=1 Tax=unclassified Alteromonas TaxID=2614992 RepID=UPI001F1E755D|nr:MULTISPECIES: hypothetical protein [unclassified Alteromonas]